jgi:hypothetical protein
MPIGTLVGFVAGAVALLVVFGIPPVVARATTPATAAEAVAGVVRALVVSAVLLFQIPRYQALLSDFGIKLSPAVELVIWASANVALLFPTFLLVAAGETFAFYSLYSNCERRIAARRLSKWATAVSVLSVVLLLAVVAVPLARLMQQLD